MTIIAYSHRFGIRCQYHCLTRTGSTENITTISAMMLKNQIKVHTLAKLQKFHLCSSGTHKPFFEPIDQDGWVHEFDNCSKESFRIVKWVESSRWPSSQYYPIRNTDDMTIGKTHSTLQLRFVDRSIDWTVKIYLSPFDGEISFALITNFDGLFINPFMPGQTFVQIFHVVMVNFCIF